MISFSLAVIFVPFGLNPVVVAAVSYSVIGSSMVTSGDGSKIMDIPATKNKTVAAIVHIASLDKLQLPSNTESIPASIKFKSSVHTLDLKNTVM